MKPKTNKLCLCFHKGDGRFVANWIKFWTHGDYSHVELYFPKTGMSFSADGYANCVRWKEIEYTHEDRWTFVELPAITYAPTLSTVIEFCNSRVGRKYDYIGAMGVRWGWGIKKRDYCNDLCREALKWPKLKWGPFALYKYAIKNGGNEFLNKDRP